MCPWGGWDHHPRRPPHWWPAGEPWPPHGPPWTWRKTRGRFVWRFAVFFGVFFLLAFSLFAFLGWLAAIKFGGAPPWYGPPGFRPFGFLFFLLILVGFIAAGRGLRRVTASVGDVMEATGRLANGDYAVRVIERGPPEIRRLARAFNDMATRLEAHEQQRRTLLAEVTHELRTPLAVMQGNLEGVLDGVYPRDDAHLAPILEEARVLSTLIEDLRTLALAETGTLELHREPTDVGDLLDDTVAAFRAQAEASGVTITADYPADLLPPEIDPTRIRQVLANLLNNALQHTPAGGSIRIAAGVEAGGRPGVTITVVDTGSGIPPADLPHIFDRFYKSKDSRGSGLGLAIARNLVALHGGTITAESEVGRGTTIRIMLPMEASGEEAARVR